MGKKMSGSEFVTLVLVLFGFLPAAAYAFTLATTSVISTIPTKNLLPFFIFIWVGLFATVLGSLVLYLNIMAASDPYEIPSQIYEAIDGAITDEDFLHWWLSPNSEFEGKSPRKMWDIDEERVINFINSAKSGDMA